MTKYWEKVLEEVLNKNDSNREFLYIHRQKPQNRTRKKTFMCKRRDVFSLGKHFPGIYFTMREAECMRYALKGKTNIKIAMLLNLSCRTVEFYINKMKLKLNCRSRSDLIEKVLESDFMKNVK